MREGLAFLLKSIKALLYLPLIWYNLTEESSLISLAFLTRFSVDVIPLRAAAAKITLNNI